MRLDTLLKRAARFTIEVNPEQDEAAFLSALDGIDVVSFDVFDTTLLRDVSSPTDIFTHVESNAIASNMAANDFSVRRVEAERLASMHNNDEPTLDRIYDELPYDKDTKQVLMSLELETEKLLSTSRRAVKRLYDVALREGKKIIFISDMYLPSLFLRQLLSSAGYTTPCDVFVSGELNRSKRKGDIFPFVLDRLGISPNKVLHIGDSLRSDYLMPRAAGLNAMLISQKPFSPFRDLVQQHLESSCPSPYGCAYTTAANMSDATQGYYEHFGAEVFGPVLYELCRWIHDSYVSSNARHLFFLARDGYIMQRAYEIMYPDETDSISYLYVSRRALRIPLVSKVNEIPQSIQEEKYLSVSDILSYFMLDASGYAEVIRRCQLEPNKPYPRRQLLTSPEFQQLIQLIGNDIIEQAGAAKESLAAYLAQEKVQGSFAVVDIGWAGSIQDFLQKNLDKLGVHYDACGFYLGLSHDVEKKQVRATSYLGFEHPLPYIGLVELCFLAREGSTIGYQRDAGGSIVHPVLLTYEYEPSGETLEHILEVQESALRFVKRFSTINKSITLAYTPEDSFWLMNTIGTRPRAIDLTAFADMPFDNGVSLQPMAKPKSLLLYLVHPRRFMEDFFASNWRIAFLKRLIKLPLPYEKIYWLLKRN